MPDSLSQVDETVFVKTAAGQQEIQSRTLGLGLMARRALILIDGKRKGLELSPMLGGHDLRTLLQELLGKGCIEPLAPAQTQLATPPVPAPQQSTAAPSVAASPAQPSAGNISDAELSQLPPAASRSPADLTMARNFMTNTVNTIFQPYTRLTLLEAIANCKTAEDSRKVYTLWAQTIGSSAIGNKRLPEFREKLFKVL